MRGRRKKKRKKIKTLNCIFLMVKFKALCKNHKRALKRLWSRGTFPNLSLGLCMVDYEKGHLYASGYI